MLSPKSDRKNRRITALYHTKRNMTAYIFVNLLKSGCFSYKHSVSGYFSYNAVVCLKTHCPDLITSQQAFAGRQSLVEEDMIC
jgi:hypothetical protein